MEKVKRLFIHIPKNGGTSVQKEMTTLSFGHDRWRDVPRDIRYIHQSFAVIRNPWARMVSRYVMGIPTSNTNDHGTTWNTFEEFLETRYVWTDKQWNDPIRSWNTQYDYVCDENDVVRCDILRLEFIDDELSPYLNLNTPYIVRENVGEYTRNYQDYYNNEQTIQIVADWYEQDIDYWGFDFDTSATKNYHYYERKKI
mgnify:FL=1